MTATAGPLRVLIGSPGSGKSTWCAEHRDTLGLVLSFDATGTPSRIRAMWIDLGTQHHAEVIALRLRVPLFVALARNAGRERVVPEQVLVDYWHLIEALTPEGLRDEGFAQVHELS